MRRLLFITTIFSVLFAQNYQSEIQPIWDNNCTSSCHISSSLNGGLNLSPSNSYSELVNVASQGYSGFMRVKPGDAMNSVLHQKIVGNSSFGERMPKGGSALSQADEQKIKTWIDNGAPQDWSGQSGGYSLSFDGIDDYVSMQDNLIDQIFSDQSLLTISAWVYGDGGGDAQWSSILSKGKTDNNGGNSKTLQIFNDKGKLAFVLYSSDGSFIRIQAKELYLDAESWNFITVTYDGGLDPSS